MTSYGQKRINKWKKFDKNNLAIALNVLYVKKINISKENSSHEQKNKCFNDFEQETDATILQ